MEKQKIISRAFGVFVKARNAGATVITAVVMAAIVGAYSYIADTTELQAPQYASTPASAASE